MNRSIWIAMVALVAVGCSSKLEALGSVGGSAGHSGSAGIGGGGGIAGFAGAAGFAGIGGIGGGPADGGVLTCDDSDPCTNDTTWFDENGFVRCCHYPDPACGEGGNGGMFDPACEAGAGGFGGIGGFGGAAGSAGFGGVGGGPADAGGNWCEDGDPCTLEILYPDGSCERQWNPECGMGGSGGFAGEAGGGAIGGSGGISGEGGFGGTGVGGIGGFGGFAGSAGFGGSGGCGEMGFDDDGDGYQNSVCGGDCDDSDADAYPWQQGFYSSPRHAGGFDYDCDGQVTLRWGELHDGCSLDPAAQACVGSGWTSSDMNAAFLPGCGQSAAYAFCEFTGNDCAVSMHVVTQACR